MNNLQRFVQRPISAVVKLSLHMCEWQRLTSARHVDSLYTHFKEYYDVHAKQPVIPGCITLCHTLNYETWWLVDGQHRVLALQKLYEEHNLNFTIMCCDIQVADEAGAQEWFKIVNNTLPLKVLPKRQAQNLSVPRAIVEQIKRTFPAIFTDSERPRRPHLFINAFAEKLSSLKSLVSMTSDEAVERLVAFNRDVLCKRSCSQYMYPGDKQTTVEQAWAVATKKGQVYFGMYKNYEFLDECFGFGGSGSSVSKKPKSTKTKVPKALQLQVWKRFNGEEYHGICYCCENVVNIASFHVAHVVPESNGGETTLENLRPTCSLCNLSCGTKNLDEFKKTFLLKIDKRLHSNKRACSSSPTKTNNKRYRSPVFS